MNNRNRRKTSFVLWICVFAFTLSNSKSNKTDRSMFRVLGGGDSLRVAGDWLHPQIEKKRLSGACARLVQFRGT